MKPTSEFTLGVDLAQESFVASLCAAPGDAGRWREQPTAAIAAPPDSPQGVEALCDWLAVQQTAAPGRCARVVVESTGQLSHRFARALAARGGLPRVAIINPRRSKAFGVSLGVRDKSDDVDARVLALYGAVRRVEPAPPRAPAQQRVRDLSRLREDYVQDLLRWQNRRRETTEDADRRQIDRTIRHLQQEIARRERASAHVVRQDPALAQQVRALKKIRGIKQITALTLTAELGDLTRYRRGELTAAAGLFPKRFESGSSVYRKPRLAKGGGGRLRRVLYMCATSLFRSKGALRGHIDRLQERGLSDMSIEGALMRKLLLIARAVVKNAGRYDETKICRQSG